MAEARGKVMLQTVIAIEVVCFALAGFLFLRAGQWRLGVAQWLLAVVQAVIYTGSMK